MNIKPALSIRNLTFGWSPHVTHIDLSHLTIDAGQSLFLQGASGSGKSTLLGLIGGVLSARSGDISIGPYNMTQSSAAKRDQIRADHMGVIFQQFNLIPFLSVIDNVTLPMRFSKHRFQNSVKNFGSPMQEARKLIGDLGLPDALLKKAVNELSVGQQQRVAVARALMGAPDLIIADEPSSALDTENRDRFIELLNTQRQAFGTSLLFVSHDKGLSHHFDEVVNLDDINHGQLGRGD